MALAVREAQLLLVRREATGTPQVLIQSQPSALAEFSQELQEALEVGLAEMRLPGLVAQGAVQRALSVRPMAVISRTELTEALVEPDHLQREQPDLTAPHLPQTLVTIGM